VRAQADLLASAHDSGLGDGVPRKAKTPAGSWRYLDRTAVIYRHYYILGVIICQGHLLAACGLQTRRAAALDVNFLHDVR
jgi:hypothetical protein